MLEDSFKDPDLLGLLCGDSPWLKVEIFKLREFKYLGNIRVKQSKIKFTPSPYVETVEN